MNSHRKVQLVSAPSPRPRLTSNNLFYTPHLSNGIRGTHPPEAGSGGSTVQNNKQRPRDKDKDNDLVDKGGSQLGPFGDCSCIFLLCSAQFEPQVKGSCVPHDHCLVCPKPQILCYCVPRLTSLEYCHHTSEFLLQTRRFYSLNRRLSLVFNFQILPVIARLQQSRHLRVFRSGV